MNGREASKKNQETSVLRLIYEEDKYNIIDRYINENPDFLLQYNKTEFGVEVTRLFYDESNARLHNIPDYVSSIIEHSQYRNKKDKKNLPVVELTSIPDSKNEKPFKVKGILRSNQPNISDLVNSLYEIIEKKNQRYTDYKKVSEIIDLVIYDYEYPFRMFKEGTFYRTLYTERMINLLAKTDFREIYFITKFDSDNFEYLQLKSQLFIMQFYLFNDSAYAYFGNSFRVTVEEYLKMFGYYLIKRGFRNIYISEHGAPLLYYSHIKAAIDMKNSFFIKECNDNLSDRFKLLKIENDTKFKIDDGFLKFIEQVGMKTEFYTKLHFNIRNSKIERELSSEGDMK